MLHTWNNMVCSLLGLVFFNQHNLSRLWHLSLVISFLSLTSAENTTVSSAFTHWRIRVLSSLRLFWIKLLYTFIYRSLYALKLWFFWDKCSDIQLLKDLPSCFAKCLQSFTFLPTMYLWPSFLASLSAFGVVTIFYLAILIGVCITLCL